MASAIIIGQRRALSNWLRQFTTIIDIESKMYKLQEGIFGIFKWGSYKPLPKISYVLVFKSFYAKCETCSIDSAIDNPNSYYQISLVYNSNRRIIVHETKSREEAFDFANTISFYLNLKIKDSATNTKQSVWLN
ncbi:MAG: hypothetical protein SFY56_15860 [Bacteroidota bacterium]|nr:hypothetical protein [Bacteroidota bacterium]